MIGIEHGTASWIALYADCTVSCCYNSSSLLYLEETLYE